MREVDAVDRVVSRETLASRGLEYTGPARVLECDPERRSAWLLLGEQGGIDEVKVRARLATPADVVLEVGDVVLTHVPGTGPAYVIGVLDAPRERSPEAAGLDLPDGSRVELRGQGDQTRVEIRSKDRELVLEWDPAKNVARVRVESGDLEFTAKRGDIRFDAAGDIRLRGQAVEIDGRERLRLGVRDAAGRLSTALSLVSQRLQLTAPAVNIEAGRARVHAREIDCSSDRLAARVASAKLRLGNLSVTADQIIQNAKDVYSTVANLSQLRAGRVRTLVESSFHLKSRHTHMKSEMDFKVQAEKIYLG